MCLCTYSDCPGSWNPKRRLNRCLKFTCLQINFFLIFYNVKLLGPSRQVLFSIELSDHIKCCRGHLLIAFLLMLLSYNPTFQFCQLPNLSSRKIKLIKILYLLTLAYVQFFGIQKYVSICRDSFLTLSKVPNVAQRAQNARQ